MLKLCAVCCVLCANTTPSSSPSSSAVEMVFREEAARETWNDLVSPGQMIPRKDLRLVYQFFAEHKIGDCELSSSEEHSQIHERIVMPDEGEEEGKGGAVMPLCVCVCVCVLHAVSCYVLCYVLCCAVLCCAVLCCAVC